MRLIKITPLVVWLEGSLDQYNKNIIMRLFGHQNRFTFLIRNNIMTVTVKAGGTSSANQSPPQREIFDGGRFPEGLGLSQATRRTVFIPAGVSAVLLFLGPKERRFVMKKTRALRGTILTHCDSLTDFAQEVEMRGNKLSYTIHGR
jgi:hypothetical protein